MKPEQLRANISAAQDAGIRIRPRPLPETSWMIVENRRTNPSDIARQRPHKFYVQKPLGALAVNSGPPATRATLLKDVADIAHVGLFPTTPQKQRYRRINFVSGGVGGQAE